MLKGGKLYGPGTDCRTWTAGLFLPVYTDFRTVFAESLAHLFHFDSAKARLFPGYNPDPHNFIDFMKQLPQA